MASRVAHTARTVRLFRRAFASSSPASSASASASSRARVPPAAVVRASSSVARRAAAAPGMTACAVHASSSSSSSSSSRARWLSARAMVAAGDGRRWGREPSRARRGAETSVAAVANDDERVAGLAIPSICPGCGVGLQSHDKNLPGFFVVPKKVLDAREAAATAAEEDEGEDANEDGFDIEGGFGSMDDDDFDDDDIDEDAVLPGYALAEDYVEGEEELAALDALNAMFDEEEEEDSLADKRRARKKSGPPAIICARCFALRTSGKVKNEAVEVLLPSFDFERVIGDSFAKLRAPGSAVVLLMADLLDFDGSFPVDALDVIEPYVESGVVDVLLVANKVDLMPVQCTRTRLTSFVRRRSKAFGLSRVAGVHLVSAKAGMGVAILAEQLEQMLDRGKEVYVVGAQNAGKSSLINRLSQRYGGPGEEDGGPIASVLPGTTLGMVKLPALLPNGTDVYDTPGLLQPFQLSSRLNAEEMKVVLPNKRVTPRTYRIEIGGTLHIGGLCRIDLLDSPQRTLYLTVWASNKVATHYTTSSKTADVLLEKHAGTKLTPPVGELRVKQFGAWGHRTLNVYGEDWQKATRDITIAGLGWVSVGCNGNASFRVWTHEGVQVETREALIPDMDKALMSPGFSFENVGGSGSARKPNDRANRQRGRGGGRGSVGGRGKK